MNDVLFDYVDNFVLVYFYDIIIYYFSLDENLKHLKFVLFHLREYNFYVKMEKCELSNKDVKFLRHLVSQNKEIMDPKRMQEIVQWQEPSRVKVLRSFFNMANYYLKCGCIDRFTEKRCQVGMV